MVDGVTRLSGLIVLGNSKLEHFQHGLCTVDVEAGVVTRAKFPQSKIKCAVQSLRHLSAEGQHKSHR